MDEYVYYYFFCGNFYENIYKETIRTSESKNIKDKRMTQLQEEFLRELKNKEKLTVPEYAVLYNKYNKLAIEQEENSGASKHQAKTMGNYYTTSILASFIDNENILARIIALHESK